MFIAETRTFGFQNVFAHAKSSAGHFRKPVRKSVNCGLKV